MTKLVSGEVTQLSEWDLADRVARRAAARSIDAEILKTDILTKTQERLDVFARTRNYDGILSACTYATSTNPVFAAEGQACVTLRDQTWAVLYQMLAEVEAGTRPAPSGFADIAGELPDLVWGD